MGGPDFFPEVFTNGKKSPGPLGKILCQLLPAFINVVRPAYSHWLWDHNQHKAYKTGHPTNAFSTFREVVKRHQLLVKT